MNFAVIMALLNYGLILIYGVLLSIDISGGWTSKKDKHLTAVIIAVLLIAQIVISFIFGTQATEKLYPLITHIPLVCALFFFMKRPIWISIVSVFTAYLCCQIPKWPSILVLYISDSALLSEICYTIAVFISYAILHIFLVKPAYEAMNYSRRTLFFLGSLPAFYYIFDYASTVYSNILYADIIVVNESIPTISILFYIVFISMYHRELKKRYSTELENSVLSMELKQSDSELAILKKSLEETATYRHDMRHHFMILGEYVKNGDTEKALQYISSAQGDIDRLTPKQYCKNKSTNLILSYYGTMAEISGIRFAAKVNIPEILTISETEICTLLSNGIENAIHAASRCSSDNRWIEIDFNTRKDNLLISIRNSYVDEVVIKDGLPLSTRPLHGLGVKSISNIAARHGGMYSFDAADGVFTMRVVLRQN